MLEEVPQHLGNCRIAGIKLILELFLAASPQGFQVPLSCFPFTTPKFVEQFKVLGRFYKTNKN